VVVAYRRRSSVGRRRNPFAPLYFYRSMAAQISDRSTAQRDRQIALIRRQSVTMKQESIWRDGRLTLSGVASYVHNTAAINRAGRISSRDRQSHVNPASL